jgi:hypothetical protein
MTNGGMTDTQRRARAISWLRAIEQDVTDLLIDTRIFWDLQEIIERNPKFTKAPGLFTHWMMSNFLQSAAVGIRRQLKVRDAASMQRLLLEIRDNPRVISRAPFVALYEPAQLELANEDFDRLVGAGNNEIDPTDVQRDIDVLAQRTEALEHFVDRMIAHRDPRGLVMDPPQLGDLDACLELLEQLIRKYRVLMEGVFVAELLPPLLEWKEIFKFAWIERGGTEVM